MRPNTLAFEPPYPAVAMGTSNDPDPDSLNESLLKALVKAKEDQRATKTALETAQAQVNSLLVENKTLKASKCLLETIVENPTARSAPEPQSELSTRSDQEQAVKEFIVKGSTTSPREKSILYDALAKQRERYETRGYPEEHTGCSFNTPSITQKHSFKVTRYNPQDDKLFSLSHGSPTFQNTGDLSAQQHNILRHFLKDNKSADYKPRPSRSVKEPVEVGHNFLIEVTTSSQVPLTSKPPTKPTVAEAVETCHRALKSVISSTAETRMGNTEADIERPPTLQLPAAFLSKYRPARKSEVVVESSVENPFSADAKPSEEDVQDAKVVSATEQNIKDSAANDATPSEVPRIARKDIKIWIQEHLKNNVEIQTAALPVVDTKIQWSMTALQPVFDNEQEIQQARRSNTQSDRHSLVNPKAGAQASYFWQHPVRFLPNPTEKNLYRTVMIDYIPPGATYQDVLSHVRTGALESIQMFPPLRGSTDYFTARVVFAYERPAVSMVMRYQKRFNQGEPVKINGTPVRIWQVLQPTYPANKQLETDIFQHGYTRILLLEHVENSGVLPQLHEKLVPELQDGSVIKITRTQDGVPMIEFTSVAAAAGAMRRFQEDQDFTGCTFDFDRDYCEDDYESES